MFKSFVFGDLVTIVIALVGGYFVLRNGVIPANADATPGWIETWAAGTSLDATLSREAQDTNPVAMTDENLIAAIKLYGEHCAICHGTAKGEASGDRYVVAEVDAAQFALAPWRRARPDRGNPREGRGQSPLL